MNHKLKAHRTLPMPSKTHLSFSVPPPENLAGPKLERLVAKIGPSFVIQLWGGFLILLGHEEKMTWCSTASGHHFAVHPTIWPIAFGVFSVDVSWVMRWSELGYPEKQKKQEIEKSWLANHMYQIEPLCITKIAKKFGDTDLIICSIWVGPSLSQKKKNGNLSVHAGALHLCLLTYKPHYLVWYLP